MNALDAIDPQAKTARVQPGIVLDRLRDAAELHHLTYAPDPATHSRCTLGGIDVYKRQPPVPRTWGPGIAVDTNCLSPQFRLP